MKNYRAFQDRCRTIFNVNMDGANSNGRYGCLTTGTVPAVYNMDGA